MVYGFLNDTSTTTRMDENEFVLNPSKEVHKWSVKEVLNALKTSPKLHLMDTSPLKGIVVILYSIL